MRAFLLAAAAVCLCSALLTAAVDSDRDFSGSWVLEPRASVTQALPAEADPQLVITQRGASVHCKAPGGGAAREWAFTTDGEDSEYSLGQEHRNSVSKWEGAALLINTLVSGPRNYTIMDRWQLSPDRSSLTIQREVVRPTGQVEALLVYRREGQTQLTVRPAAPAASPVTSAAVSAPTLVLPPATPSAPEEILLASGTRIPLTLVNSVSTKHSKDGDHVYLETAFPVFIGGHLVVPRGSYVSGTITQTKAAGHVKGKSEMFIRFDSLTLPNGVSRDFLARAGSADASATGRVDKEGRITGQGNTGVKAGTVARDAGTGASVGSIAGVASGHYGMGVGLGGAAGALAGLAGALGSRGPDTVLPKGTTLEMVLDRDLRYKLEELRF